MQTGLPLFLAPQPHSFSRCSSLHCALRFFREICPTLPTSTGFYLFRRHHVSSPSVILWISTDRIGTSMMHSSSSMPHQPSHYQELSSYDAYNVLRVAYVFILFRHLPAVDAAIQSSGSNNVQNHKFIVNE